MANYNLSTGGQSAGHPVLGAGALTQKSVLTAYPLRIDLPILGRPVFAIRRTLAPSGLSAGHPTFSAPTAYISRVFGSGGFGAGTPRFGAPPLGQRHQLTATALRGGNPVVGVPAFNQRFKTTATHLLYQAATGFERSLVDVELDRLQGIDAELVSKIWDPYECPIKLLPYLGWAMGVEYWDEHWSESTKRAWIDCQLLFKSLRGTRAGLIMAVDYAGRDVSPFGYKVLSITTRPQFVFSGPSMTKAEREDWLSRLPQVREWRIREGSTAGKYKAYIGSSRGRRQTSSRFCIGGAYMIPSTALDSLKRRARWIENGVETDMRVTEFGSYFRLHRPSTEDSKVFIGRPFQPGRYFIPSTASQRLITIQPAAALPWRSAVTPTLEAVTAEPELIKEEWQPAAGKKNWSVFCDIPMGGKFFIPTRAPYRIYLRYSVLDPTVKPAYQRNPIQFMGTGRFGFPAFTAWVDVQISSKMNRYSIFSSVGFYLPKLRFFIPHDGKPLERVREAIKASKSLRDKILLRTGPRPRFIAGEKPLLAGVDSFIVGRP